MENRENPDLIKLKFVKIMKRKIFLACAALVVSAAAVVGVKAYNYYSMSPLMRANLEALSQSEGTLQKYRCFKDYRFAPVIGDDDYAALLRICDSCYEYYLYYASNVSYCGL